MTDDAIGKTILKEVCDQCGKPVFPLSDNTAQARLDRPGFCHCKSEIETQSATTSGFDPQSALDDLVARGYSFGERLGKGSLGYVYQATATHSDAFFAIKIFDRDLFENKRTLKRLEQEVSRARELSHPNIATVYEFGISKKGFPYLIMDFLPGPSLAEVIKNEGFLDVHRVVDIALQITDALEYSHEKNLLHRDLKPSNIYLLRATGGGDYVKLSDLGVAKALPNPGRETRYMTPEGEEFGNPSYMSPEQCLGERLTPASDLYSLGCVLYEALSGKLPLSSSNPVRLAFKQVSEDPKNLAERFNDLDIPVPLSDIVMTLLQKSLANRFATATDLKEVLTTYKDGKKNSNKLVKAVSNNQAASAGNQLKTSIPGAIIDKSGKQSGKSKGDANLLQRLISKFKK